MGGLCADSMYSQIKEKNPQDFQKYLEMNEVTKALELKSAEATQALTQRIDQNKQADMATIDAKNKEVRDHFASLRQQVDRANPGGVAFLESSRNAKLEDILGLPAFDSSFSTLKDHVGGLYNKEQVSALSALEQQKAQLLTNAKAQTPRLDLLENLAPEAKQNVLKAGLSDFKDQIEARKQSFLGQAQQQLKPDQYLDRFKGLLQTDRLESLTQASKARLSENAANLIGKPGQGKAVLY